MPGSYVVVVVNYHRVGFVDPENPLHRLHTVPVDVFEQQLDHMQARGKIVSLNDVRSCRDLASLNYVISFDDAPISALDGIERVLKRGHPLTLSVCGQLASHGRGARDKVYCIEKYIDPEELSRFMRSRLPAEALGSAAVPFYDATKRDDLDPDLVTAELIDPLFAHVAESARPWLAKRAYLSWETARRLASHPLVTVANHSWSHANLAAMSRTALESEILRSHSTFAAEMGWRACYFTVPFGRYSQRLAVDLLEILQPLGYQGILWMGRTANLVRGPYRWQVLQLMRLHTPPALDRFVAGLRELDDRRPLESAVRQVRPTAHSKPVRIIEISDEPRSCRHEMIVREGKDYASCPEFYRYQFTDNPYKGDRADLYAVECDGRIEATAYNFHTAFSVGGVSVPGVYLSSWRRLPEAHRAAAGTLVQRMTAREPIVGVYNPSPQAALAFRDWSSIRVFRLSLPVTAAAADEKSPAGFEAVELDRFDDAMAPLCDASAREAGFTVVRDQTYQEWRHGSYPLAACRYTMLLRQDQALGYAVTLRRDDRISVVDFYASARRHYAILLRAVVVSAMSCGAATVGLETSDAILADEVTTLFGAARTQFDNLYHLNTSRLAAVGAPADVRTQWRHYRFHETETTSDVLIR